MEAGRQGSFGKKESRCEHIVCKNSLFKQGFLPADETPCCFERTESSPSIYRAAAPEVGFDASSGQARRGIPFSPPNFPASAVGYVGTGSSLSRTNVDVSPDSSPSVD